MRLGIGVGHGWLGTRKTCIINALDCFCLTFPTCPTFSLEVSGILFPFPLVPLLVLLSGPVAFRAYIYRRLGRLGRLGNTLQDGHLTRAQPFFEVRHGEKG